jgi:hypothetical protein
VQPPARCGQGTDGAERPTVYDALSRFGGDFLQRQDVPFATRKVLNTLLRCRSPALGGHSFSCDHCGFTAVLYNSCGSRYCPRCQGPRRYEWAEKQQALLLPTPHSQVVFTLPAALRPIARVFPKEVYNTLFDAAKQTLLKLAATHWNAKPTILSVLHTWARNLSFHPHVHCVVSSGGLTADGRWVDAAPRFLFPHAAMQCLFRGIFLRRLRQKLDSLDPRQTRLFRLAALQRRWVVFVEAADGRDKQFIVKYLARYVYNGPISDHRIVAVTDAGVAIRTRGAEVVQLPGLEFARRFAMHILPKGFRRIRPSGLLAPTVRARLEVARKLLGRPVKAPDEVTPPVTLDIAVEARGLTCPDCGGRLRFEQIPPDRSFNPCSRGPP